MNVYDLIELDYGKIYDRAIDIKMQLINERTEAEIYSDHVRENKISFMIECLNKIIYASSDLTEMVRGWK